MKRFCLSIAAALSLGACAAAIPAALDTLVSISKPAATAGDKVVLEGTRGLILAHNAFQGANALVVPLVRSGRLSAAQVDRYEAALNRVEQIAPQAHSTLSAADRATELLNIADEFNRMAGR